MRLLWKVIPAFTLFGLFAACAASEDRATPTAASEDRAAELYRSAVRAFIDSAAKFGRFKLNLQAIIPSGNNCYHSRSQH